MITSSKRVPQGCCDHEGLSRHEAEEVCVPACAQHHLASTHGLDGDELSCPSCSTSVFVGHGDFTNCRCGHTMKTYGNSLYVWPSAAKLPYRTRRWLTREQRDHERVIQDAYAKAGDFGGLGRHLLTEHQRAERQPRSRRPWMPPSSLRLCAIRVFGLNQRQGEFHGR